MLSRTLNIFLTIMKGLRILPFVLTIGVFFFLFLCLISCGEEELQPQQESSSAPQGIHVPEPDGGSFGFVVNARDIFRSGLSPCRAEVIIGSVNSEFAFSTNLDLNTNSHTVTVSIPVHALTEREKEYLANNEVPIRINIKNENDDILGGFFDAGKKIVKKAADAAVDTLVKEGKKLVKDYTGVDLDTFKIPKNPSLKDILKAPDFEKALEHVMDWGGKSMGIDLSAITNALESIDVGELGELIPSEITNMQCLFKEFDNVVAKLPDINTDLFDGFSLPPIGLFDNTNVDQMFCFNVVDSVNQFGDKVFSYVAEYKDEVEEASSYFAPYFDSKMQQVFLKKLADTKDDYEGMIADQTIPPPFCFRLETLKNGSVAMVPEDDPSDNAYIEHSASVSGASIAGGQFKVKYKNPNAISASPNFRILTTAAGWEIKDLGTFFNQPVVPPASVEIAFESVQRNCSAGTSKFEIQDKTSVTKTFETSFSQSEKITVISEMKTTTDIKTKLNLKQGWGTGSVEAEAQFNHKIENKKRNENTEETENTTKNKISTNKTLIISQSLQVPPYSIVRGTGFWRVRENLNVPVVQKLRVTAFASASDDATNFLTGDQMLSQINGMGFTGTVTDVGEHHLIVTLLGEIAVDQVIESSFASEDLGTCGQ